MIEGEQISTVVQREGSGGRLRTLVLGLELWALAVALPSVEHGVGNTVGVVLLSLPVSVLAVGELCRARAPRVGRGVLLGAFPVAIAIASAARPELALADAWGGAVAPLVALSLFLYLVVVLHSFARPAPTRATGWQPVPEAAWTYAAPARLLSTGVALVTLAGAFVAAAVVPFAWPRAALEERFPLAADDARTLAVALAGGLFAIALGAVIGPGLRARRVGDDARERIGRSVTVALVIAALAAIAYAWLRVASMTS